MDFGFPIPNTFKPRKPRLKGGKAKMKKMITLLLSMVLLVAMLAPVPVLAAKSAQWNVPGDFSTIQAAIDSPMVAAGDTILVGPGSFAGALVSKSVKIKGLDGAVINSGPLHGSGMTMGFRLLAGSSGTSISHLRFEVDLAIIPGPVALSNVTIDHNVFVGAVQAVSAWRASGWTISHNEITDLKTRNGGGIGILIGDYTGGMVKDNVVSHNRISGTLYVGGWYTDPSKEKGGYNGSGIVLYADFRGGAAGAAAIKNNNVVHNDVSLASNNPGLVDVVALEMTDTRDNPAATVIFDNVVGFNDFRGTELQIDLTPDNLGDYNAISRNLGDNRGHGLHPSVFAN